jgi:hypothetical protein
MIIRIWTTGIVEGRESEYLQFAHVRSIPMFRQQPGCLGVLFGRADGRVHGVFSFWRSSPDVDALATSLTYRATAEALARSGVLAGTPSVTVYEAEGGVLDGATLDSLLDV